MEREGCVCECLKIPGVCFDPSDEELVAYYLTEKIEGRPLQCNHLMTELPIVGPQAREDKSSSHSPKQEKESPRQGPKGSKGNPTAREKHGGWKL